MMFLHRMSRGVSAGGGAALYLLHFHLKSLTKSVRVTLVSNVNSSGRKRAMHENITEMSENPRFPLHFPRVDHTRLI